ncbi:hypothetical protein CTI12_AA209520 [Artemisia annua]|uniref:Uncharacterized protein n=1 Tax=Artemisia annua TaxID=35608 RepID=A0A2U1NZL1_ARTAN|nr:hypothetical protein CTI12_AA209520 [Artemisia annua]
MERGKKVRDPRRGGRGSRGGSIGAIRPRIQSQPGLESSSQAQPYHPQMYPQSPPLVFYTQQPLPQIPTNFDPFESNYNQQTPPQMSNNFDPYEPRYTQQKRRERVSEPLPIRDDTDDDEYFDNVNVVPETQQIDEEQFEEEEEEEDVEEVEERKTFSHSKAWYVLKDQAKWKEQPLVSQTQESTGSNKKRKSSESSSAQTPTNETPINVEYFEFELPNLNENPTPSRQFKGKKK